jgi:lipoprotein-anchoring transpeptidase ErfK/SrfK
MRTRIAVIAGIVAIGVLVLAGGVFAYDSAHKDTIAKGVTVDGIDVGGMTPAEASARLKTALVDPLNQPVVVKTGDGRFKLTPKRANLTVNVDSTVDQALARSRDGNMLERTWRSLRGAKVDAALTADVSYSRQAITKLVKRVSASVDEPAVDASVDLEDGDLTPQTSKAGKRLQAKKLRRQVRKTLLAADPDKVVQAHTAVVKPKVTTDELAKKYPVVLMVNRSGFKLSIYKDLKLVKTYGIAVGQIGLETPAGLYHIQNKAVNPAWTVPNSAWAGDLAGTVVPGGTAANPLKARWMGIFDGAGIHGTDASGSIGSAASHGCIRMLIPDVIELYDEVPVGAPIYIA